MSIAARFHDGRDALFAERERADIHADAGDLAELRAKYRRIAPWYDILDSHLERSRYPKMRAAVFGQLCDAVRILDCGMGTGRNVAHYPAGAKVIGFDLSAEMLARARGRVRGDAAIVQTDALRLPFANASFDAAAATFLFCVLPDALQVRAIREICRVVKPGGRIVLLEYVLSRHALRRFWMRLWGPWIAFAYGASFTRHTREHLCAAGVAIESRRFLHCDTIEMLVGRSPGAAGTN
jgi:ubiquinone/menaquinone biosynthesis C-methylase UbiE